VTSDTILGRRAWWKFELPSGHWTREAFLKEVVIHVMGAQVMGWRGSGWAGRGGGLG
jgi:hypothetical protein